MLLEVLLSWHDHLDGSELVATQSQMMLRHQIVRFLPTSLEAGDDWADESTLKR